LRGDVPSAGSGAGTPVAVGLDGRIQPERAHFHELIEETAEQGMAALPELERIQASHGAQLRLRDPLRRATHDHQDELHRLLENLGRGACVIRITVGQASAAARRAWCHHPDRRTACGPR